jgi:type I restriction enzyme S subunit
MSSEWSTKTVGEFCPFKYGKGLPERDRKPGRYGVYSSAGLVGSHEAAFVNSSGVVIGRKGTVGSVTYSAEPFWPIDTAFYVEDQPAIRDIRFTYYLLKTLDLHLMNTDSAVPGLNRENAHALEVRVPSIQMQKIIADFLQHLDDRITLLRETNITLEAIAQALFKSWFVDFDPVHAKMQGRTPEGMDEASAALFPDSFQWSELGAVPMGWKIGVLADLMQLHKGSINPLNQPNVMFSHYSLPAFDEGQVPVFELGAGIRSNKTTVPPGAVLVSKLNPHIPRIWLPSAIDSKAVCSTEFLPFVPTSQTTTNFVYALLIEPSFMSAMTQLVTGTSNSHQRIKPDSVLSLKHVVPQESIIKIFDEIISPLMDRMKATRQQIQSLSALRDRLLPRLISGQLSLEENVSERLRS